MKWLKQQMDFQLQATRVDRLSRENREAMFILQIYLKLPHICQDKSYKILLDTRTFLQCLLITNQLPFFKWVALLAFKRLRDCSTKELIASFEARLSFFEARLGFFEARLASFETRLASFEARLPSFETRLASFETSAKLLFTPFPFLGRYEYFGEEILGTKISISVVQILYFRSLCGFCTLEASARFCHLAQTDD